MGGVGSTLIQTACMCPVYEEIVWSNGIKVTGERDCWCCFPQNRLNYPSPSALGSNKIFAVGMMSTVNGPLFFEKTVHLSEQACVLKKGVRSHRSKI